MDETRETIVNVSTLSKVYGQDEVSVRALDQVSFTLAKGDFVAVAGPSGSGKSTLLNILGGLDAPSGGQVAVDGVELGSLSRAALSRVRLRKIGFVFQSYNLLPVLTAYENAEYVLLLQGVPAQERRTRVMALLERVGLGGLEHRFPRQLSGGQQQRVAVARSIVAEPALVLADEPTANLDSKSGESLIDLMVELNQEKRITFLFSTHDPHVMSHARRILRLTDGRIAFDGAWNDYQKLPQ
jgi:putative ABC transport system ATP-binding protein